AISVAVPVGEGTADALREKMIEKVRALKVGHSYDPDADYGPLVTSQAKENVVDYIGQGEKAGADIVVDGRGTGATNADFNGEPLSDGFFIGPTLIDHVT